MLRSVYTIPGANLPPCSSTTPRFHSYSVTEARQSVLCSVGLGLAQLRNVKRMSTETLDDLS